MGRASERNSINQPSAWRGKKQEGLNGGWTHTLVIKKRGDGEKRRPRKKIKKIYPTFFEKIEFIILKNIYLNISAMKKTGRVDGGAGWPPPAGFLASVGSVTVQRAVCGKASFTVEPRQWPTHGQGPDCELQHCSSKIPVGRSSRGCQNCAKHFQMKKHTLARKIQGGG